MRAPLSILSLKASGRLNSAIFPRVKHCTKAREPRSSRRPISGQRPGLNSRGGYRRCYRPDCVPYSDCSRTSPVAPGSTAAALPSVITSQRARCPRTTSRGVEPAAPSPSALIGVTALSPNPSTYRLKLTANSASKKLWSQLRCCRTTDLC